MVTYLVNILLVQCPCNMGVIVFLPSFLIGASFMKAPNCLWNWVSWEHHLGSQNLWYYNLLVGKLNIRLEHSDELWIDCLRPIERVSRSWKEKCLVEFKTNLLEFLDVKKMYNMYERLIVSVYGNYLFRSHWGRWSVSEVKWEWYQESHCFKGLLWAFKRND